MSKFYPSSQTDLFANNVALAVKDIMKKHDLSFEEATKIYELGAKTQLVDMFWMMKDEMERIGDAIDSVGDAIESIDLNV